MIITDDFICRESSASTSTTMSIMHAYRSLRRRRSYQWRLNILFLFHLMPFLHQEPVHSARTRPEPLTTLGDMRDTRPVWRWPVVERVELGTLTSAVHEEPNVILPIAEEDIDSGISTPRTGLGMQITVDQTMGSQLERGSSETYCIHPS